MFKIGLQVYSVRGEYAADYKGTFKKIKELGYEGIELFGGYDIPAVDVKAAADEAGLEICGYHTNILCLTPETIDATLEYNKVLENNTIIVPSLGIPLESTLKDWEAAAAEFKRLNAELKKRGFRMGFHSHRREATAIDGGILPWDYIAEHTDSDFIMQIDIGNTLSAGTDPVELYRKYAERGITVHYKPYKISGGYSADIGSDDIDWNEIINISMAQPNIEWAIIECENENAFIGAKNSFDGLKKLLK